MGGQASPTADRVYKLKKPVVLDFLDYGTPERRRTMCTEELRLNSRLAPGVYLAVRGLAARGDGLDIVADDDPMAVDYAVEMRRYDDGRTLAALAARTGQRPGTSARATATCAPST